jgi:hypothetical protein
MKGRKYGGVAMSDEAPSKVYSGGDSNVVKEAKERKKGGKVGDGMPIKGKKAAMRLDRPGRKSGGRVGADSSPLSSAAKTTNAPDHTANDDGC